MDKLESALKQRLRDAGHPDPAGLAGVTAAFLMGRLQRFARSGFRRLPSEHLDDILRLLFT
jgi:TetR/AcrR family transcriptional regulator